VQQQEGALVSQPLQIASNFIVISDTFNANPLAVTDNFYAELEKKYGDFAGDSLISCHSFENDWPTWESHLKGDEFIIVTRGVWHTAKVHSAVQMPFVTPGEGTENLERPPGREA
jgi:hypothetical protein